MIKDSQSSHGTTIETPPALAGSRWGTRQVTSSIWWPLKTDDRLFLGKGVTRSGQDYRPLQYQVKIITKPTPATTSPPVTAPATASVSPRPSSIATARQSLSSTHDKLSSTLDRINASLARYATPRPREGSNVIRLTEEDVLDSDEIPGFKTTAARSAALVDHFGRAAAANSGRISAKSETESAKAILDAEKDITNEASDAGDVAPTDQSKVPEAVVDREAQGREDQSEHDSINEDKAEHKSDEDDTEEDIDEAPIDDPTGHHALSDQSLGTSEDRPWSPCEVHDDDSDSDSDADSELEGGAPNVHHSEVYEMCFESEREEREHFFKNRGMLAVQHRALQSDSQAAERALYLAEMTKSVKSVKPAVVNNHQDDDEGAESEYEPECSCKRGKDHCEGEKGDEDSGGVGAIDYRLWCKATLEDASAQAQSEVNLAPSTSSHGGDAATAPKEDAPHPLTSESSVPIHESEAPAPAEETENVTEADVDEAVDSSNSAEEVSGDTTIEDERPADAGDLNNDADQLADDVEDQSDVDTEDSTNEDESMDDQESMSEDDSDSDEESVEEDEDVEEQSAAGTQLEDDYEQSAKDDNITNVEGIREEDMAVDQSTSDAVVSAESSSCDDKRDDTQHCKRLPIASAGLKRSIDEVEPEEGPHSTHQESAVIAESCNHDKAAEAVTASTSAISSEESTPSPTVSSSSALVTRARASLDRLRTVKRPKLSVGMEINTARVRDVACGVALGAVG